jgi:addiction module HigA family antidote
MAMLLMLNERTIIKIINMEKLRNIHPGEVLLEEFLIPLGISAYRLSKEISIPQTRISEIIKGKRRITADTALRLSKFFGNSAKFWLGLQDDFDIEDETKHKQKDIETIKQYTFPPLHDTSRHKKVGL